MWKIANGFFVGLVLLAPAANAQFNRQEVIAFESAMMPSQEFLAEKKGDDCHARGLFASPER